VTVVSIAGGAGSGKSQLALAVVRMLGEDVASRVPMDWYLVPRDAPMAEWLRRPLAWDHDAVRELLAAPGGETRLTPPFDCRTFQRSEATGERKAIPIRPVMLLDAMEPWPDADLSVLLDASDEVRWQRIAERDVRWRTRVIEKWDTLQMTWERAAVQPHRYDLVLDGTCPIEENASRVVAALRSRG
jgi:uridine kinase